MSKWTLIENSKGELEVTVEGAEWATAVDKAFKKLGKELQVGGFRKGHVPAKMVEKYIPVGARLQEAVNDNMQKWFIDALTENDLEPIDQATPDVKEITEEKVTVVFTFTVEPEAKVLVYKDLDYTLEDTTVTDEEIAEELKRMAERYAEEEVKEAAAELGDTTVIDFEGFKDGVPFEGGKGENHPLKLGSGQFIPGFEDQLVGKSAGEEVDVTVTFPEDYQAEDLAGKECVFKVKVNEVKTRVIPEIDDDFAKDLSIPEVETVEDLKKTVVERLENNKKNAAETKANDALVDELIANTEVTVPEVMIDNEVRNIISDMAYNLQNGYGISLTSYLQMMGQTEADLKEQSKEQADKNVKLRLALAAVAKAENLAPTDEEVEEELNKLATQYGMTVEAVKANVDMKLVSKDLANQKAFNFVKDNAKKA